MRGMYTFPLFHCESAVQGDVTLSVIHGDEDECKFLHVGNNSMISMYRYEYDHIRDNFLIDKQYLLIVY